MQVKGSVIVITGGASGIGETVAKDFAKGGAKVVLGDVNQAGLDRVVGAPYARRCRRTRGTLHRHAASDGGDGRVNGRSRGALSTASQSAGRRSTVAPPR